jgi:hypothetical protein
MMSRNVVVAILLVLLVVGGAIGVGGYAYNIGVAQGMAGGGKVVAPVPGAVPYVYGAPWMFHRGWGFGLGPLACVFPLLFFVLIFALVRSAFWHGHGWRRGYRRWEDGAPPMFEEWHRQAHGTPTPETPAQPKPG